MTTAAHSLAHWADTIPDALAFRQIDRQMNVTDQSSWHELVRSASVIAARLLDAGVLPGEPVLVAASDPLPYVRAVLGCFWAGVIAVPLPHSQGRRAAELEAHAHTLCAPRFGLRENLASPRRGSDVRWLSVGGNESGPGLVEPLCGFSDTALLQLSSGSTGAPKAAQLLHRNLQANQASITKAFGHGQTDQVLGWLPLNHDMGLIGNVLQTIHLGATCTLLPVREFTTDPLSWVRAISRFGITTSGGPDAAYALVAELIQTTPHACAGVDLRSWRCAFSGAEPIRSTTLRAFATACVPYGFDPRAQFNCYGLAEASLFVAAADARDTSGALLTGDPVGCGVPSTDFTLRIVDPDTRKAVADGQDGEVWIAGPSVASAYWGNERATEDLLHAKCEGDDTQRFMRTGDVGQLSGGRLVITGRLDNRMTFFGRKVHAEAVESVVAKAIAGLDVERVVAFPYAREPGAGIALVVEGQVAVDHAKVRDLAAAAIAEAFSVPLLDIGFARQGQLPRTTSGKRRRSECSRLLDAGRFQRPALPKQSGITFLDLVAQALGRTITHVDLQYDWRGLGGDSLSAVRLSRLLALQGTACSVEQLLTAGSVSAALSAATSAAAAPVASEPACAQSGILPRQLLLQSQLDGTTGATHMSWAAWLDSCTNASARFASAWTDMCHAYEALRTTFVAVDDGWRLTPLADAPCIAVEIDANGWADARVVDDMRVRRTSAFLEGEPLVRTVVYCRGTSLPAAVCITAHHAVCDLTSLRILVGALFDRSAPGRESEGRLAALENAAIDWEAAITHFGTGAELALAADRPAPRQSSFHGEDVVQHLAAEQMRRLAQVAVAAGCSTTELLTSLWGLVLARLGDATEGQLSLAIDMRAMAGLEGAVGCGVGVTDLHFTLSEGDTVLDLLRQGARQLRAALAGRPQRASSVDGAAIAPSSTLNAAFRWLDRADAAYLGYAVGGPAKFDAETYWGSVAAKPFRLATDAVQWSLELTVALQNDGSAQLVLGFATARFDSYTARAILRSYDAVARAVAAAGLALPACRVPMAGATEQSRLAAWSTGAPCPQIATLNATLSSMVAQSADRYPHRLALRDNFPLRLHDELLPAELTFGELQERAALLARHIAAHGIGKGAMVGLVLPRSSLLVIAMLATLRTGAAFATFNPAEPAPRLRGMLADIDCQLILTVGPVDTGVAVLDLAVPCTAAPENEQCEPPHPDSPAYAMFTSGSTGRPKAVLVQHRAIVARIAALANELQTDHADVVLHKTAPTFDVSLWEIFLPLSQGFTFVIAAPGEERDPDRVEALIVEHGVTIVHFVPSMLAAFLAHRPRPCAGARLRAVVCSGETLSGAVRDAALDGLRPGVQLWNYYGPTEAAIDVCHHRAERGAALSPIGRPVAQTTIHILDRWGETVPAGGRGEIWIGGVQLGLGYVGQPALTAAAF